MTSQVSSKRKAKGGNTNRRGGNVTLEEDIAMMQPQVKRFPQPAEARGQCDCRGRDSVMQPQVKGFPQSPEAGRGRKEFFSRASRKSVTLKTP